MSNQLVVGITGANGFLGSNLCRHFLQEGFRVVAFTRSTSNIHRLDGLGIDIVNVDKDRFPSENRTSDPIRVLIHTATCYGRKGEESTAIFDANVQYPMKLLRHAQEHGVRKFINTDTVLPDDFNDYSRSKATFREAGADFAVSEGLAFINVRLQHMFGPWDSETKFTTHVIRACASNVPSLGLTKGEQRRDFIYIEDVVTAYSTLVHHAMKEGPGRSELEVGSGSATRVKTFVELAHRLTHSRTKLDFGAFAYRPDEVMDACADTSKLQTLGWRCKYSIEEGIQKTIDEERLL
jgi:CDP-paratose synthetase